MFNQLVLKHENSQPSFIRLSLKSFQGTAVMATIKGVVTIFYLLSTNSKSQFPEAAVERHVQALLIVNSKLCRNYRLI